MEFYISHNLTCSVKGKFVLLRGMKWRYVSTPS